MHLDGSNCFDQLNTISLTGTLTDGLVSLISASVDGQVITFTVNLNNTDSNALAGTYAINGGCANGDQGNVTGSKVPAINGTWRIILDINDALEQDRTTLAQESTGPEGSFGVNGTAFINAPSCFSGTITSGTFPSPSYIMGTSVNLEIETADGTITFLGTMDQFGTKILGSTRSSAASVAVLLAQHALGDLFKVPVFHLTGTGGQTTRVVSDCKSTSLLPSLACKSGSVASDGSVVSTTASSVPQAHAYEEAILGNSK